MKKIAILLALSLPAFAYASNCEEIKQSIATKIENNGVPTNLFELKAMPNKLANQQTEGKIVGTCGGGQKKIVYIRYNHVSEKQQKMEQKDEVLSSDTSVKEENSQDKIEQPVQQAQPVQLAQPEQPEQPEQEPIQTDVEDQKPVDNKPIVIEENVESKITLEPEAK